MRYPEEHKELVRGRIVEQASQALRRHGLDGVSIPDIMKRAGLTHGGFYAHFKNRDQLVAEAVHHAAEETRERVFTDEAGLSEALGAYLSPAHAGNPAHGCVLAALGADAPRQKTAVRRAFAHVARGFIGLVQGKLQTSRPARPAPAEIPSDDALRLASTMVGAVVLARLVDDEALAARILGAARHPPTP